MPEDKNQLQDDINNFAKLVETAKGLILDKVPVFPKNFPLILLFLNLFESVPLTPSIDKEEL